MLPPLTVVSITQSRLSKQCQSSMMGTFLVPVVVSRGHAFSIGHMPLRDVKKLIR